jgi:hypothetical protein
MLALDIGIKHLAYCSAINGTETPQIQHWSLVNLTDLNNTESKPTCATCGKPAKALGPAGTGLVCGRHIAKDTLIYDEATGEPIKKAPTIGQLQAFLKAKGQDPKRDKRPALLERVKAIATMPLEKKKSVMSFADNTTRLHDAIRGWITRDWQYLVDIKHVYIEHQPVLKNPVMKTVQLLIFASLRERYLTAGKDVVFHFVHAGKKVKGAEVGDAGYKDRKAGSEERCKVFLAKFPFGSEHSRWLQWWTAQSKKDDLADALCMILDSVS